MSFVEFDLLGIYIAPIVVMMILAYGVFAVLRSLASRAGWLSAVWHPGLFEIAIYLIILSSLVLLADILDLMPDSSTPAAATNWPMDGQPLDLRPSRVWPIALTLVAVAVAAVLTYAMWQEYMGAPWTRDGSVRVYVVSLAPEVSGRVLSIPVADNQFVHKGDLLMTIDPRDYAIAIKLAEASVAQSKADAANKRTQAQRRLSLTDLATTPEERESYVSAADMADAVTQQQIANLDRAKLNLERASIRSPVNGWVTNLQVRVGDYATMGTRSMTIVDADSFWVDGYFEETKLARIAENDPARVWLLGYKTVLRGHVEGVARAIVVGNAAAGTSGLADVNPIFTWVRLAQRVPVRVHLDDLPPGVRLVAGMTATVEIDGPGTRTAAARPSAAPVQP